MATQIVYSNGIYHGLPTFPDSVKGLTALITGANGISGHYMLRVLAQNPERWTKIYCLSRRPPAIPDGLPPNAQHIAVDFLKTPEEIADVLEKEQVQADYAFFFSYIQVSPKPGAGLWSDAEEMSRVNTLLLKNLLDALKLTSITPKSFMLQTGGKNYGVQMGPVKQPHEEWDPRVELEPNFYYFQEDALWAYCKETGVNWGIACPASILGAVPDASMNALFPLAVYAVVCKHMNQVLAFPGDIRAWQNPLGLSSSMLNAYLEEWVVLNPATTNQKFNIIDSSAFALESFWPRLAAWYGIRWEGPKPEGLMTVEYGYEPPPRGYGPRGSSSFSFTMVEWALKSEVQSAWKEIASKHDLVVKELTDVDRIFGFFDRMLLRGEISNLSMNKARKLGWHGYVDTSESILDVFEDFVKLRMIPPVPKVEVKFL